MTGKIAVALGILGALLDVARALYEMAGDVLRPRRPRRRVGPLEVAYRIGFLLGRLIGIARRRRRQLRRASADAIARRVVKPKEPIGPAFTREEAEQIAGQLRTINALDKLGIEVRTSEAVPDGMMLIQYRNPITDEREIGLMRFAPRQKPTEGNQP